MTSSIDKFYTSCENFGSITVPGSRSPVMGPRTRPLNAVTMKLGQGSHLNKRKLIKSNRSDVIWRHYDVTFLLLGRYHVGAVKTSDFVQKSGNYTFNTKFILF